jgi:Phytanoyl-CoA dioxygenase (PhyH)
MKDNYLAELDQNGIVMLHDLLPSDHLRSMQRAFEIRLARMRWNDSDGYEKTEFYRHMIQDVLTLDQGFLDLALHPIVKQVLSAYLGPTYQLVEAKGWLSLPTARDFHGWHGDAWYDQQIVKDIPREVKVAMYLTDVKTGAFHYIKGSHRKQHPRLVQPSELKDVSSSNIVEAVGQAGTVILFDTSGIHRQGMPILEPRQAVFLNYHDPAVPLQKEDRDYYRYHPLILNAAFLGNLSGEDSRILGFGDKRAYVHAFRRRSTHPYMEVLFKGLFEASLRYSRLLYYRQRAFAKLERVFRLGAENR